MNGRTLIACLCLTAGLAVGVTRAQAQDAKPIASGKAAPLAVEEPRDVVATLYRLAAVELKKPKGVSPFYSRAAREKYFSKGFDLLITNAETKAAHEGDAFLDFDPISASQDAELQKVTLKTDMLELSKAVVSASFSNHGQPTVVSYDFVKEEDGWKVNDIKGTTEKEAWSVRKILKAGAPQPKALPGETAASKAPDADTVTKKVAK
jgi:hypothetical protein